MGLLRSHNSKYKLYKCIVILFVCRCSHETRNVMHETRAQKNQTTPKSRGENNLLCFLHAVNCCILISNSCLFLMYIAPFGQHSISSTVYGIYFFRFVCCVEQPFELVSYCYIDCTLPITCLNSIHLFLMRCICTLSHYRNTLPLALTLLRSIECYQYLLGLWVEHYECSAFLGHFAWAKHILAIFQHTFNKSLKKKP